MTQNFKSTRRACYTGYVTQAVVVNLAPLFFVTFQNEFKVSLSFLAALTLVTFVVQIFIDVAAVKFIEKTTYRTLAVFSQFTSAAGLLLLAILPKLMAPEPAIIISALLYSSGSGLSEVVLSPLIESLPTEGKSSGAAMSLMHSFYSWGQAAVILISTLSLKLIGGDNWFFLPLFWALIPVYNGLMFTRVPMAVDMDVHDNSHGFGGLFKQKEFLFVLLIMICAGASEMTMSQWASMFAEKGLGVTKVVGDILGPCLFAALMGSGRTLNGLFVKREAMHRVMVFAAALTFVCYLVTVFVPVPMIALLGCGLSGLGVSIMWPGMLSICAEKYPGGGASMFALLAVGGDVGCSLGPWIAGIVSDVVERSGAAGLFTYITQNAEEAGLRSGILTAAVFPLLMLTGVLLLTGWVKTDGNKEKATTEK